MVDEQRYAELPEELRAILDRAETSRQLLDSLIEGIYRHDHEAVGVLDQILSEVERAIAGASTHSQAMATCALPNKPQHKKAHSVYLRHARRCQNDRNNHVFCPHHGLDWCVVCGGDFI